MRIKRERERERDGGRKGDGVPIVSNETVAAASTVISTHAAFEPCIRNSRVFVGKVSAGRYANTRPYVTDHLRRDLFVE